MNKAEALEVARGEVVMMHEDVSPCVMMITGLDLEEQQ